MQEGSSLFCLLRKCRVLLLFRSTVHRESLAGGSTAMGLIASAAQLILHHQGAGGQRPTVGCSTAAECAQPWHVGDWGGPWILNTYGQRVERLACRVHAKPCCACPEHAN
uniref:Uncharacterized protein n=1 Tax=Chlamydomonas leiostraca TaxID=1034604 RepID=A0A7S0R3I5_9CHLO